MNKVLETILKTAGNRRKQKIILRRLEGKTLKEVGAEFNLTKERIRQIEQNFLHRIILEPKITALIQNAEEKIKSCDITHISEITGKSRNKMVILNLIKRFLPFKLYNDKYILRKGVSCAMKTKEVRILLLRYYSKNINQFFKKIAHEAKVSERFVRDVYLRYFKDFDIKNFKTSEIIFSQYTGKESVLELKKKILEKYGILIPYKHIYFFIKTLPSRYHAA